VREIKINLLNEDVYVKIFNFQIKFILRKLKKFSFRLKENNNEKFLENYKKKKKIIKDS